MTRVPAYVLAGGRSSRFGTDKARANLAGVPLIRHVAEIVRRCCDEPAAVADLAGKYADLGLRTIADRRAGLGPLAGVEAALSDRLERLGPGWVVLASCDLAGLKREWVETLTRGLPASENPVPFAVAFKGEFWQPFPAAYHTALLPAVSCLLDEGRASFQRLLTEAGDAAIPLPLPDDWPVIVQANTPEELATFDNCNRGLDPSHD